MILLRQWFRSVRAAVDADDVLLVIGLALLAYGAHQVYPPAGYLVPGIVLVWLALPPKPFPIIFTPRGKDAR